MKVAVTTRNSDPQLMAWDTSFWGIRTGRATKLDGLSEWAVANTVGMVALLIDAKNPREAQVAEAQGFRFMDVRMTLQRATARLGSSSRVHELDDIPVLRSIARTAFPLTRFYADPTLDRSRCDDLYEEWTRASCAGAADIVLVADRDAHPVGYVTVSLDGTHSEIGLIAVAADWRGQGIGQDLVSGALNWARLQGAEGMTVVTQGANIGAIRTFEACGFRSYRSALWFHKRY